MDNNEEIAAWLQENTDEDVHEELNKFRKANSDYIATIMARMITNVIIGDLPGFNDELLIYGTLVATHAVKTFSQD